MSKKTDTFSTKIIDQLLAYGLDEEAAKIYLFLLEHGEKSALQISRDLSLARTKVYRILDNLYDKKLVLRTLMSAGFRFIAAHPKQLQTNLKESAAHLQKLEQQSQGLIAELSSLAGQFQSVSEVRYFNGLDGLKQVTYNSLAAKNKLSIFELDQDMSKFIDYEFSEQIRKELVANRITTYQLTNLTKILPYTEVSEMVQNYWKIRHIPPKDFQIRFEVLLYNDVCAMYTYQGGEAFCVEIHNANLTLMQQQLFKFVWKQATPMEITDTFGGAVLR